MTMYAGNLSRGVTEDELREEFRMFGRVAFVNIVKDRSSGISSGFGFVDMPVQVEAESAISALHGKEFKGQTLTVNEARHRTL